MSRQTIWTRLEPSPETEEMTDALRAPIRDPLWMLGRQWQVSEFEGEDAGSPIRADLSVAEDRLTRVELRGSTGGDPFDYEGEPLEATVERERVLTDDDPPIRRRAETGQQFLRLLAAKGYGEYTAAAFPDRLRLDDPGEALESPDRRYVDLMADRALDGTAVARSIQSAVDNIGAVVADGDPWSGVTAAELPLPTDGTRTGTFDDCVEAFYGWYVDIYEEPTAETGSAWDPTRLEYDFAVATGGEGTETVFEAEEYTGGHLDWHAFSSADGESLDPPEGARTEWSTSLLPSRITFPGMPAPRWWEFEESDVDLSKMVAEGAPLTRLMLTEFATVYGNDWFRIPVESPVGTLSRVTDLTVTDSFGVSDTATAATDDSWRMFMHDLPDGPGLFVPPTLGTSWTSDPVEEVTFARDELANLVFAIERIYEGPTGRPVDRTEFAPPAVHVETVREASDPDEEYVVLANPGEDRQPIDGYEIEVAGNTVYRFGERTLSPDGTVTVYTGLARDEAVGAGLSESAYEPADSLSVRNADGELVARRLLTGPSDALADYRLSTDVPEYWFPFTVDGEHRLEQSLLLDGDSLGLPVDQLPRPLGEILNPSDGQLPADEAGYKLYDEEVTRSGRTVTRRYQFARWLDGSAYLWGSRESRPGDTQLDSGLRFDTLDERE